MREDELGDAEVPEQGRNRFKALIIIVSAMVGLLLLGIAFAVAQFTIRTTSDVAIASAGRVTEVALDIDRGRVEVDADRPRGADLGLRLDYFLSEPKLDETREGTAIDVTADCDWPSDCEIDVDGGIQAGADLRVRTSSGGASLGGAPGAVSVRSTDGDVTVRGARGDVNVGSSSGDLTVEGALRAVRAESASGLVTVSDHGGPLRVRTQTGFVVAEDLRSAESQVEVGSGRIELQYVRPPERVEVDLSEGILEIEVPSGVYRIDIEQRLGDRTIEGVRHDPDAPRRLVLRVNEGNVIVRGT